MASVGNHAGVAGPGPVPWDFYIVPWAPGASSHDRALADALGARFRVEIFGLTTLEQECDRVHSIADLARRCVGQVSGRTRPGTPIGLMGLSFGGRVAVEVAAQLRARGHTIAFLCVGDIAAASGYDRLSRRAWKAWAESGEVASRWGRAWRRLLGAVRSRAGLPIRWMARMGWQGMLRGTTRMALAVLGETFRGGFLAAIRQSQIPGWVIPRHEGELVLMVTDDTASVLGGEDPTFGWRAHAGSVRVVRAEGNHNDYFSGKQGPAFRRQVLALAVEAFGRLEGRL